MAAKRYLIVNADDFGQSHGVNRGIIKAHAHGIVTSASLMVRWPAATEAAAYGRAHPKLSLGLHVDFGEWAYRSERWVPLYEVVPISDRAAVTDQVAGQLAAFRRLVGKDPTHLDSHQHVHLREPIRTILSEVARELAVPLRHCSAEVRYRGDFYGQTAKGTPLPDVITVEGLLHILATLPPGTTELGCHPGEGNDLDTMYCSERAAEVNTLCDPRVRAAIAAMEIELRSFLNLSVSPLPSGEG
ncbi:MAG: ChbG/HpnK family deacetylase [Nitrospinae bacterium]|nr:ChbG/HpnK family deacetylase [Nitrospinota bacterium]